MNDAIVRKLAEDGFDVVVLNLIKKFTPFD